MRNWSVKVTEAAERDLVNATLYIRDDLASPTAAVKLIDAFEGCVSELSIRPEARPLVRDVRLARMGYRWMPARGYMVFYTIDSCSFEVTVERVLYGRSNWTAML